MASVLAVATACGGTDEMTETPGDVTEETTEEVEEVVEDKAEGADVDSSISTIDTSMYQYATEVTVTDAIELNNYVSLMIYVNEENDNKGLQAQHVLNQTYDFLLQDAIEGADYVGINVVQGNQKILMFEVDTAKFQEDDEVPMADLVLRASEIEMIHDEVRQFAEVMEWEMQ
ncbi:hypothetical protein [Halalkalibacter nanhaiisediminis]|nr:hypothetical protein [Halalkalibacter nanhaiisediminis]